MPIVRCPFAGCDYATGDVEPAVGGPLLMIHGYTHMPVQAPPPGGGAGPRPDTVKPKVEKPTITAGASNDEWTNFQRDWSTYKSICGLPANQVNKHLLDCCQEDLKHLLYGIEAVRRAERVNLQGQEVTDMLAKMDNDLWEKGEWKPN